MASDISHPSNDSQPSINSSTNHHVGNCFTQKLLPLCCYSISHLSDTSTNALCGAIAGLASGIVICPLDVIKTRLQAQHRHTLMSIQPTGLFGMAKNIWTYEGLRGFYRGLSCLLLGYLPSWAVYMSVYHSSCDYFDTKFSNTWLTRIFASFTAGACSTVITSPIWVIKTRIMTQTNSAANIFNSNTAKCSPIQLPDKSFSPDVYTSHTSTSSLPKSSGINYSSPYYYSSILDAVRQIYRTEGFRAFYAGLTPALLGLTHIAIQLPLYEHIKVNLTDLPPLGGISPHESGESISSQTEQKKVHRFVIAMPSWVGVLTASIVSKIVAILLTYPHEVIRTRMHIKQIVSKCAHERYSSDSHVGSMKAKPTGNFWTRYKRSNYRGMNSGQFIETVRKILQDEGWRTLYVGMGSNMIRAVPAAVTTLLTFESLAALTRRMRQTNQACSCSVPAVHSSDETYT